jgi:hypothetical protein
MQSEENQAAAVYSFVRNVLRHLATDEDGDIYVIVPQISKDEIQSRIEWERNDRVPAQALAFFESEAFIQAQPYVDTAWWIGQWLRSLGAFANEKARREDSEYLTWCLLTKVRIRKLKRSSVFSINWGWARDLLAKLRRSF